MLELDTRVRLPVLGQFKVRRALRITGLTVCLTGLLVGVGWDFILSDAGFLLALLLGTVVGMKSSRIRNYELYGDLLLGIGFSGVLAWVVFGTVPALAFPEVQLHDGIAMLYTRFWGTYLFVTAVFCIGLFCGLILDSYDYQASPQKAVLALVLGLGVLAAGYILLADIGGTNSIGYTNVLGWEVVQVFVMFIGGAVALFGVAGLARKASLGYVLLAMAVVTTAFAGAGFAAAYEDFTTTVVASEIDEQATGEVENAELVEDELHITVTVENPTDRTFTIEDVGSVQVREETNLLARGALSSKHDPGPQELEPGESVTIEYTLPLSPTERDDIEAAMEAGADNSRVQVPGDYEGTGITVRF